MTPAGFAVFSSYQAGLQALQTDITTHRQRNPNQTLQQFISTYAPLSDRNNPVQYAQNVADALGVSVDTPLKQLAGSAPAGIGQGSTSTVDLGIIPGPGAAPSTTSTPTVVSPAGLYTVTSAAPGALGGLGIIAAAVGLLLVLQD